MFPFLAAIEWPLLVANRRKAPRYCDSSALFVRTSTVTGDSVMRPASEKNAYRLLPASSKSNKSLSDPAQVLDLSNVKTMLTKEPS